MQFSIEILENLAATLGAEEKAKRTRLQRLIRAYSRIIALRDGDQFQSQNTEMRDEDGYYDNSYPPEEQCCNQTGPELMRVEQPTDEYVGTSDGFYHDAKVVTEYGGVYVDASGDLWQRRAEGTVRFGSFAAHPGWCNREIGYDFSQVSEPTMNDLLTAEEALREIAFPMVAELMRDK